MTEKNKLKLTIQADGYATVYEIENNDPRIAEILSRLMNEDAEEAEFQELEERKRKAEQSPEDRLSEGLTTLFDKAQKEKDEIRSTVWGLGRKIDKLVEALTPKTSTDGGC